MKSEEIKIKGNVYKFSQVDAFEQLYVVKRIAPLLGALLPMAKDFREIIEDEIEKSLTLLQPVVNALSALEDKDLKFVIMTLLSGVERQQELKNWAKVVSNGSIMFDNVRTNGGLMLTLTGRALVANLSDFLDLLPSALQDGLQNQKPSLNG